MSIRILAKLRNYEHDQKLRRLRYWNRPQHELSHANRFINIYESFTNIYESISESVADKYEPKTKSNPICLI
jgi:hypothetical protein